MIFCRVSLWRQKPVTKRHSTLFVALRKQAKRKKKAKNTVSDTMMAVSGGLKEMSPTIPSGIARMKHFLLLGLAILSGVYAFLVYALRDSVGCWNCRFVVVVFQAWANSLVWFLLVGILLSTCRHVLSSQRVLPSRFVSLSNQFWAGHFVCWSLGISYVACLTTCPFCHSSNTGRSIIRFSTGEWAAGCCQLYFSSLGLFRVAPHWGAPNPNVSALPFCVCITASTNGVSHTVPSSAHMVACLRITYWQLRLVTAH